MNSYRKLEREIRRTRKALENARDDDAPSSSRKKSRRTLGNRILLVVILFVVLAGLLMIALPYFRWQALMARYMIASWAAILIPVVIVVIIIALVRLRR